LLIIFVDVSDADGAGHEEKISSILAALIILHNEINSSD
jgi:hypothetical protein